MATKSDAIGPPTASGEMVVRARICSTDAGDMYGGGPPAPFIPAFHDPEGAHASVTRDAAADAVRGCDDGGALDAAGSAAEGAGAREVAPSCIECGQSFTSLDALRRHIRLKPTRDRSALLGCRVSVMWAHSKWYEGWVLEFEGGKHRVDYDDGERKWYDMSGKTFYIIRRPSESKEEQPWLEYQFNDARESVNYAVAQSRVYRAYNRPQQVGYRTSGHLCITNEDKCVADESGSSLLYGEVLPRGVCRMLDRRHLDAAAGRTLFDLGMGTGKLAMQAFIQHPNLTYVYGVELAGSRYEIAEAAVLNLVRLYPEDYAVSKHHPDDSIAVATRKDGRILKFERGNLLEAPDLDEVDIAILQTNIPDETYPLLCEKLLALRPGARLLTYLNLGRIWTHDEFPYCQMAANVSCNDRFSTSWSVHRGCHFFLWDKLAEGVAGVRVASPEGKEGGVDGVEGGGGAGSGSGRGRGRKGKGKGKGKGKVKGGRSLSMHGREDDDDDDDDEEGGRGDGDGRKAKKGSWGGCFLGPLFARRKGKRRVFRDNRVQGV